MNALESLATHIQNLFANISIANINHAWLVVGLLVVAIVLVVFTQEKNTAVFILLCVYTVWFLLTYSSAFTKWLSEVVGEGDVKYVKLAFGLLPLVALLAIKKKRRAPRTLR